MNTSSPLTPDATLAALHNVTSMEGSVAQGIATNSTVTGQPLELLSSTAPEPVASYTTTIFLIVILHIIFIYHFNTLQSRKRVLVSYKALVQQKRFYRLFGALLSHLPDQPTGRILSTTVVTAASSAEVEMGHAPSDNDNNNRRRPGIVGWLHDRADQVRVALQKGPLSGFPCLAYNCHFLWSCRALEGRYQMDSLHYARVLILLAVLSVTVDAIFSRGLLILVYADSLRPSGTTDHQFEILSRIRRSITHRPIGSMTVVSAAVMTLFSLHHPHVAIPVVPVIPNFLSPMLSYLLGMVCLIRLSRGHQSIFGTICSVLVGVAWAWLSWDVLADFPGGLPLWLVLAVLTGASLQIHEPHWVPCIDHVSWNASGGYEPPQTSLVETTENDDNENDALLDDGIAIDQAFGISLRNETDGESDNDTEDWNMMLQEGHDDDDNDDPERAPLVRGSPDPLSPLTFTRNLLRSRRGTQGGLMPNR